MKALEKIHKYLREDLELGEEDIRNMDGSSVYIAQEIAIYAHRNQYRENGEKYLTHPLNCLNLYRHFVGITLNDPFCIDADLMAKYGIPFEGVQEVCILHDVLEDTEITMEEIADIYSEVGLQTYFELYIMKPLELITHDKSMPYPDYIAIANKNPISAMVKMIDMVDNLNVLGLCDLDDMKIERSKNYLNYIKVINDKYHFIENAIYYKIDFAKENQ